MAAPRTRAFASLPLCSASSKGFIWVFELEFVCLYWVSFVRWLWMVGHVVMKCDSTQDYVAVLHQFNF